MVPVVHPPFSPPPPPTSTPAPITSPDSCSLPDFTHMSLLQRYPSPVRSCSGQLLLVTHHPVQIALPLGNAPIQAYTASPLRKMPFPCASRNPYLTFVRTLILLDWNTLPWSLLRDTELQGWHAISHCRTTESRPSRTSVTVALMA